MTITRQMVMLAKNRPTAMAATAASATSRATTRISPRRDTVYQQAMAHTSTPMRARAVVRR